MSGLAEGESPPVLHDLHMHPGMSYMPDHPTSRQCYKDVEYHHVNVRTIATISHIHRWQEGEPEGLWDTMLRYLKDNILPEFESPQWHRAFLKRSHNFITHNERLWKTEKRGHSP